LITSTILSLYIMPFVSKCLSFWLQPAYRPVSLKTNLIGAALAIASLVLMVLIFNGVWGLLKS
ncbi:MAG: hypothetical protein LW723_01860, partial [Pseudanabaena sp. 42896M_M3]|nr:hypothetical protein [Pseudanabaena sp. 42896M_M3]